MAGKIIVSEIQTDNDNNVVIRANTGNVLFRVTDVGLDVANSVPSGSITSDMIADGTVIAADVADGSITTAKIADGNVTVDKIASDSINATKLNVSGNGDAGQALLSDGDGSFSWGSAGRSDATSVTLSSGTPNVTLTSSSNQLITITSSVANGSITMPDMTTVTEGEGYFVFNNTSNYNIAIKDSGGVIREFISSNNVLSLKLSDNGTATGVFQFGVPPSLGVTGTPDKSLAPTGETWYRGFIKVTSTQYVVPYRNTSTGAVYLSLATLDIDAGTWTYGTGVLLGNYTLGGDNEWEIGGASNGVDKGYIAIHISQNTATSPGVRYFGFAIVSDSLYVSSALTGTTILTNNQSFVVPTIADYLGADDTFFNVSRLMNTTSTGYCKYELKMLKVTVSGTTVTLTQSANNTVISVSGEGFFKVDALRTGLTSYILDEYNISGTFTTGKYISCTTATNTFTIGTRTTQSTAVLNNLIGWGSSYNSGGCYGTVNNTFIINSTNTRAYNQYGVFYAITNPGTATVTVTHATDITYKSFTDANYST